MTYLDKYPSCIGCPVSKYCGTMVSSIRLCNSYEQNKPSHDSKSFTAFSREMTPKELDDYAEEQIRLSLEIM